MRYLSTTEAAALLRVDASRVRLLCKQGRIKTIKVGGTYGIAQNELARFAALPRHPGRPRRNETTAHRQRSEHATLASDR